MLLVWLLSMLLYDLMKQQKTAIVIGAGIGGLTAAARLSKDGYAVTV